MEYYTISKTDVIQALKTNQETGLTANEVKKRQEHYGLNVLTEKQKFTALTILFNQFSSYIVWILIIAASISWLVGDMTDALIITAIIVLNAMLGFYQEFKAENAMQALKKMNALYAKVKRDGKIQEVDAKELVPGDMLILEAGQKIPADARVLEAYSLSTSESALTGESTPVSKHEETMAGKQGIGDQRNMLFKSTLITQGTGKAIVTSTGMQTEFGKIAEQVQELKEELTPLQKKLATTGKQIAIGILAIAVLIFIVGMLLQKTEFIELLLTSVSLAVAAIPEGLPAVITITLALGMKTMAEQNALVRKMPAAESLGSCNIICSDKTGTLTRNEMNVQRLYTDGKEITATGNAYEKKGTFLFKERPFQSKTMNLLLTAGVLCNNAVLETKIGDPTELALLGSGIKQNISLQTLEKKYQFVKELPFNSERKRMTKIFQEGKKEIAFVKGSPESMLAISTYIMVQGKKQALTAKKKKELIQQTNAFAKQGLRVLGFGFKEVAKKTKEKTIESKLVFLGLQAMMDTPRKETKEAIALCKRAGIEVKMITGDHALTAKAIAEQIGLTKEDARVIEGKELETMTDKQLANVIDNVHVFARVDPEHKTKIIAALKHKNYFVAMTGDGVNDAPALKKADIGIAMGIQGTDVSKEASDIVLRDDNFSTIVTAIKEGRKIYDNIKNFIKYLLGANFAEVLIVGVGFFIFPKLVLLPAQILWLNLVTDSLPALALGNEKASNQVMERKPRNAKESLFHGVKSFIIISGVVGAIAMLAVYAVGLTYGTVIASTMAFTALVVYELVLVFNCRDAEKNMFQLNPFTNKLLIAAVGISMIVQFAVLYVGFFNELLHTAPLGLEHWGIVLLGGLSALIVPLVLKVIKK